MTPILIFMKKIANSLFGAPNCRPFGDVGGLPIGPKWTNLKIFQSYIEQNQNWKGVCFMKKIANSCIWGPILWAVLDIFRGLPIGPELSNFNFLHKIQIQRGSVLWKKLPTHVFEAPFCGPFLKNGGSADRPRMGRFENFSTIFHTKSEFREGLFYEKMC